MNALEVNIEEIREEEIKAAIKKLKNVKMAGNDGIAAELLKYETY